jgi:hypothetical protein
MGDARRPHALEPLKDLHSVGPATIAKQSNRRQPQSGEFHQWLAN